MPPPTSPIHVWIIEDDTSFRDTLTELLQQTTGITVGQRFGSVEGALRWLDAAPSRPAWTPPDVLLLDINLPGMTGIEGLGDVKTRLPDTHVVMLTIRDETTSIFNAFREGASGYLLKNASVDRIVVAVCEASTGGMIMPPTVARTVLGFFQQQAPARDYGLTERERDVLREMVNGRTQKEIAEALFVSPSTVSTHVQHIYEKLHVHSGTEAVAKAVRERLVDDDSSAAGA